MQSTVRFSRGNDDSNGNLYETAVIELTLTLDTSGCQLRDPPPNSPPDTPPICEGRVAATLKFKITPKTGDPQFSNLNPWRLRPSDTTDFGRLRKFTSTPNQNPPPAPPNAPPGWNPAFVDSTIETEVQLDPMHCSGRRRDVATIEEFPGAIPGPCSSRVTILIDVQFSGCGSNPAEPTVTMDMHEVYSGGRRTPLVRYEDDVAQMMPHPYPAWPGVAPTAPEAREWMPPP
jgi:hypothetical protein